MKKIKIWAMAAMAMLAASCSNNDLEESTAKDMADTPVTFQVGVNELTSRAGYASGALTEGEFGLFFKTYDDEEGARYNGKNIKVTGQNGNWTSEQQLYWKCYDAMVDYRAYMPYQPGVTQEDYIELKTHPVQNAETFLQDDFLHVVEYSKLAYNCPNGLPIKFQHKLAKLKIVLTKGTEVDEDLAITNVTISNCLLNRSIQLETGGYKPQDDEVDKQYSDISMYGTKSSEDKSFNDTWEAILVQQDFGIGKFTITVTVGEGDAARYFQCTLANAVNFVSGTLNTLTLKVGRDKVVPSATGITAQTWGDGGSQDIETDD